mmetsp:Transcript_9774/g.13159  ORF Transcript_9774/g.13159 Transcript_9774/m.13159 type:complete len:705 (-) Transcript_9774:69-2183(-)|eukprot:CAMPEP_0201479852 /NCGR_PEP_ID=MMETSP0151_2-20130828/4486_1 /ASSEMBLY_ACC=CAM_ASM_000257 /TAXON_ID=200890 /ORGANISM="Paramoeba atlantica, Strain 621/1 / CCAP 1560/9" /LENGTH=704 /DNA_ID=CAMNT_0047861541 /DNA_START=181 /DNA_END=2295 /DNA_ORIENTATION=-
MANESEIFDFFKLIHYSSTGDLKIVKSLVEKGLDVNQADYDLRTPLHLAASNGHADIVEFLVAEGAAVNAEDRWGGTPLQDSMREKHDHVSKILRLKGAKLLDQRTAGEHLCKAASFGDVALLNRLLENQADVNSADYDSRTGLHLACAEGHLFCVEILIKHKADLNATDRWGNTPLLEAVNHKHDAVSALLRQHGAELVCLEKINSALMTAVGKGDFVAVKRLLENGADAKAADYDQRSALHIAAAEGFLEIAEYLGNKGADVNAHDRWNGTPLDDANKNEHSDIQAFLRSQGAKPGRSSKESEKLVEIQKKFAKNKSESKKTICPAGKWDNFKAYQTDQLVSMMKEHSEWPDFTGEALHALHAKMEHDGEKNEEKAAVMNYEGLEVILAGMKNYPDHENIQLYGCFSLFDLSEVEHYNAALEQDGAIGLILHSLKNSKSMKTKLAASSTLSAMTFVESYAADSINRSFSQNDGMKICFSCIRSCHKDPQIVAKCVNTIWHVIFKDKDNIERIKYNNGVDAIVFSVREHYQSFQGYLDVVEIGMGCLSSLMSDRSICSLFLENLNGVELTLECMREYPTNTDIQTSGVAIMALLVCHVSDLGPGIGQEKFKRLMMEKKGVEPIKQAMSRFPDNVGLQENGALFFIKSARLYQSKREKKELQSILSKDCKKAISKARDRHKSSDQLAVLHREVSVIEKEGCVVM